MNFGKIFNFFYFVILHIGFCTNHIAFFININGDNMKINVGVVGIGNLGTALIKQLKNNPNFNLVATFSRRNIENTIPYSKILDYKEKIDLLFLCVGSQNNLEPISNELLKDFNLIESYDNHKQLAKHIEKIDKLAKNNKKIVLSSIGWDPGLFSLMRGLFSSIG